MGSAARAGAFGPQARPTVTHLFNGMPPLHHRSPGPAAACLRLAAAGTVAVELIADGVHLDPETVRMVFDLVGAGNIALVTDSMAATGLPDGDYDLGPSDVVVHDGVGHPEKQRRPGRRHGDPAGGCPLHDCRRGEPRRRRPGSNPGPGPCPGPRNRNRKPPARNARRPHRRRPGLRAGDGPARRADPARPRHTKQRCSVSGEPCVPPSALTCWWGDIDLDGKSPHRAQLEAGAGGACLGVRRAAVRRRE